MEQLRTVSKTERIIFPIITTIIVAMLLPSAVPLVGMLMLGNLAKESGVVDRLSKAAQNELLNIITIFLGVSVGATANSETFLQKETLLIILLGLTAFSFSTAGGVLFGKIMYKISGGKSTLIGSAGIRCADGGPRFSSGRPAGRTNKLFADACNGPNVAG